MEVEKKRTILGLFLKKARMIGAFLFIAVGISFLLFSHLTEIQHYSKTLLSPLGIGNAKEIVDPYYQEVLHSKTTDHYPPNSFFPANLVSRFTFKDDLSVEAYAVMDRDTGELLYGKNIAKRLPIASLTKIMTSLLVIEKVPLTTLTTVSLSAANIGEASMGLSAKEKMTIEELLYGAMLPSGNDAAETLAEAGGKYMLGISQDVTDGGVARRKFISSMNKKTYDLGMLDTYFFNPTGLDEDKKETSTFSTALDLLALTNYALKNETFAKIVNTRFIQFPFKDGYHKAFYLENILTLSKSFDGIKGVKPGTSHFAKETLVSYIEREGRKLIVVILGSEHTKDDVLTVYKQIFPDKKKLSAQGKK